MRTQKMVPGLDHLRIQRTTHKSATVSIRGAQIAILASGRQFTRGHGGYVIQRDPQARAHASKGTPIAFSMLADDTGWASRWEANMNVRLRFGRPKCPDGVPPSPALNASVRVGLPGKRSSVTAYLGPVNDRTFSIY